MLAAQTLETGAGIPAPRGLEPQPAALTCQNEPPVALVRCRGPFSLTAVAAPAETKMLPW
jgi:hypothetical protein